MSDRKARRVAFLESMATIRRVINTAMASIDFNTVSNLMELQTLLQASVSNQ